MLWIRTLYIDCVDLLFKLSLRQYLPRGTNVEVFSLLVGESLLQGRKVRG